MRLIKVLRILDQWNQQYVLDVEEIEDQPDESLLGPPGFFSIETGFQLYMWTARGSGTRAMFERASECNEFLLLCTQPGDPEIRVGEVIIERWGEPSTKPFTLVAARQPVDWERQFRAILRDLLPDKFFAMNPEVITLITLRDSEQDPVPSPEYDDQDHPADVFRGMPEVQIHKMPRGSMLESISGNSFILADCDEGGFMQVCKAPASVRARCIIVSLDDATNEGPRDEQIRIVADNALAGGFFGAGPCRHRALVKFIGRSDLLARVPGLDQEYSTMYRKAAILRPPVLAYLVEVRKHLFVLDGGWTL